MISRLLLLTSCLVTLTNVWAACAVADGVPGGVPIGRETGQDGLVLYILAVPRSASLGGLPGADALCTENQPRNEYDDSQNPTWQWQHGTQSRVAFLSSSTVNARDRFPTNVEIVNTKGECIAGAGDLFLGLKLAPFLLDQFGNKVTQSSEVYTGTNAQGNKAGLGLNSEPDVAASYGENDDPAKYCNDWTSSSPSGVTATVTGGINEAPDDFAQWVLLDTNVPDCDSLRYIYCISEAAYNPTILGDPQFVGLQGQQFQVHGIPEEYFALVSHPFFALNSHFTYLATGSCTYNDTQCWTHPGTYVDELGVMLPGYEIGIKAGEHQHGLRITINGQHMTTTTTTTKLQFPIRTSMLLTLDNETISEEHTIWLEPEATIHMNMNRDEDVTSSSSSSSSSWLSSSRVRISWLSLNHVLIETPVATVDIWNAEHFFNFGLELHAPRLLLAGAPLHRAGHSRSQSSLGTHTKTHTHAHAHADITPNDAPHPNFPLHGLVGQTWKNVKYPHGRLYAGDVDDYMLADRRLFSTSFVYNEYQY